MTLVGSELRVCLPDQGRVNERYHSNNVLNFTFGNPVREYTRVVFKLLSSG